MKKFLNRTLVLATVLSASNGAVASNFEKNSKNYSSNEIDSLVVFINENAKNAPFVLSPRTDNTNHLLFAAHGSHQSHQSHGSHASHASHQSHYSGY